MTFLKCLPASCPLLQYQSPYSLHLKQRPRINLHNFNELTERHNFQPIVHTLLPHCATFISNTIFGLISVYDDCCSELLIGFCHRGRKSKMKVLTKTLTASALTTALLASTSLFAKYHSQYISQCSSSNLAAKRIAKLKT